MNRQALPPGRSELEAFKDRLLREFTNNEMRLKLADSRAKGRGGW